MAHFHYKIEQLKELLQNSDNFSEIFDYFLRELADHENFLQKCKKANHPKLKQIVKQVAQSALQSEVQITRYMLLKFPALPFFHGGFFANGNLASLFFFQDVDMGLMSISLFPLSSETRFTRFRALAVDVKGDRDLVMVPGGQTWH